MTEIERMTSKRLIESIPDSIKITPHEQQKYCEKHGIVVEKLADGTTYIGLNIPSPDCQETEIKGYFRVGGWNDPEDKMGLAHLTEHAVFLGSPLAPTQLEHLNRQRHGGYHLNGNTDETYTKFIAESSSKLSHPDQFGITFGLDHLLSILTETRIPDLEKEKQVIIDEYLRKFADPNKVSDYYVWDQVFPTNHPMHLFITGTDKTIPNISNEDIENHVEKYYVPQNAILTVLSWGDLAKHTQVASQTTQRWIQAFSQRHGTLTPFPEYDSLCQFNPLSSDKIYRQKLPFPRNRIWVGTAWSGQITPFTKEVYSLGMALEIITRINKGSLREAGYGYNPEIDITRVPYVGVGVIEFGIMADVSKMESLTKNLKLFLKKGIYQAIKDGLPKAEVRRSVMYLEDNKINLKTRFNHAIDGLQQFGQIIRTEDLNSLKNQVQSGDVKVWLEEFAENPGALFVIGDIPA